MQEQVVQFDPMYIDRAIPYTPEYSFFIYLSPLEFGW